MAEYCCDLRTILSQNIKNAREISHITQAKLAECAGLSLSSIIDIERCRTWVSDKTLRNIAKALNMEAYQLLTPGEAKPPVDPADRERQRLQQISTLINAQKAALKKTTDEQMADLLLKIIQLYAE